MDEETEIIKECMRLCSRLREDKTCTYKDDKQNQFCTLHPNQCCAFCEDAEDKCEAKDICTILF